MFVILPIVLTAIGVMAYENGKTRSKARWDEARRRAAESSARRERESKERADAWSAWFDKGISAGPRKLLWWFYAAGWTAGGAIAAVGAGAAGVYSGAIAGGKTGWELGQIAGKNGRKYRETFRAWRAASRRKPGEPIELGICGRCKGWIAKSELQRSAEHGWVCPDCVPSPKANVPPWVQEHNEQFERGALKNEPIEVVHDRPYEGVTPGCKCGLPLAKGADRCALCLILKMNRQERQAEQARRAQRPEFRCERCGTPMGAGPRCEPCRARTAAENRKQREESEQAAKAEEEPKGPIRVTAERIYPEQEEPHQKEIAMTYALPAGDANGIDTSAENYDSTVPGLAALASAIEAAKTTVDGFVESLAASSLDADTLNTLSNMQDALESLAADASGLTPHVEERHGGMAQATTAAGGSQNVAQKTWYDGH